MEFLAEYSYLGLFLSAFLAATILPLSSEIVLGVLLADGMNSWNLVGVATVGNVLGSMVNYGMGMLGSTIVFQKWLRRSPSELETAEKRFAKYGVFSLLFAWVPVIGDPLTVVAGMLRVRFWVFLILVGMGKFLRYWFIAMLI